MAIYQFVIELMPEVWAKNNNYNVELLLDSGMYDLSASWNGCKVSDELISTISKFLPPSKSWHEDLLAWGNDQHNDIQLWKQDDIVESITIRLDLRDDKREELIAKVISLATKLGCALFLPESKQIINSNYSLLHEITVRSSAAQYITNPSKYLKDNVSRDQEGKK